MLPDKNSYIYIHSFKHDGSMHRTWSKGFVLDVNEECYTIVNNKTLVSESDGRKWYTREPAIWFFFPNYWFNVICMIRKSGLYYYCNLASPALYDREAVKYIDYDLDVKVFPDGSLIHLDEEEYVERRKSMCYSEEINIIVRRSVEELVSLIESGKKPFQEDYVLELYRKYQVVLGKRKNPTISR